MQDAASYYKHRVQRREKDVLCSVEQLTGILGVQTIVMVRKYSQRSNLKIATTGIAQPQEGSIVQQTRTFGHA
jgi:hypothetical protein